MFTDVIDTRTLPSVARPQGSVRRRSDMVTVDINGVRYDLQNVRHQYGRDREIEKNLCEAIATSGAVESGKFQLYGEEITYEKVEDLPVMDSNGMAASIAYAARHVASSWIGKAQRNTLTTEEICMGVAHGVLRVFEGANSAVPKLTVTGSPFDTGIKHFYDAESQPSAWPYGEPMIANKPPSEHFKEKYESTREKLSISAADLFD